MIKKIIELDKKIDSFFIKHPIFGASFMLLYFYGILFLLVFCAERWGK